MKFLIYSVSILFSVVCVQAQTRIPQKYTSAEFSQVVPVENRFSNDNILTEKYVEIKSAEWKACHQQHGLHLESANENSVRLFLNSKNYATTLEDMDAKQLNEAVATAQPWSGDYWAYARGILGYRFQDEDFLKSYDWLTRFEYVLKNTAAQRVERMGIEGVNSLSPSEKYDLIIGDDNYDLTRSMWNQGKVYQDSNGIVQNWMGICHGWAAAAIMQPRPVKSVEIYSPDKKWQVSFNPSEIKGLVSYSWATNSYPARSLGSRCDVKNPPRDENGRVIDPLCQDLNPAAWHMSVVHLIGQLKKAFVMDATYDYEVWNQPVIGYKYSYFNVNTQESFSKANEAIVNKSDFPNDPFAKYRSDQMVSVVGIKMRVGYVVESSPNTLSIDSPDKDIQRWVQYTYDLELDKDGKIIGGEWHTIAHPDFIWMPFQNAKPLSYFDYKISNTKWNSTEPLPDNWIKAALSGSAQGTLLNGIAENILIKAAN